MSRVTRRGALSLMPAAAAAAVGLPPLVQAAAAETPEARCDRLFFELREALNDAWGGNFGVTVFPSRFATHEGGGAFFNVESHCRRWRRSVEALERAEALAAMTAKQRAAHHIEGLKLALIEMRPGGWRADLIRSVDDGEVVSAAFTYQGPGSDG